jgi:RNA polymerase II subunit A-like phosphatase
MEEASAGIGSVLLPKNLLFPLTVLKIHVQEGDKIEKHTPIFTYRYYDFEPIPISELDEDQPDEGERKLKKVENVGTFDSTVYGLVHKIHIKVNDEIKDNSSSIIDVIEECSHPIQYGGLCAVCGQTIEEEDANGRTPISMAHGSTNLKVSSKEAENIERSSTERLLKGKKLSLVVDLDQTVIHVTVDPTVADWMADPTNPNYEAVKDVKSFILEEPPIVPFGYKGPQIAPTKRWYYVKLRPKLQEFLSKMNERYEMHIYTMATRQYAEAIAKIIDPDGIYFGDRILSRDESGSLTQKSLKRLFPVDTSMVVVIDDRGDVWNWSPNLIKVVPYDFFLGIGDINSSFLPRQQMLLGPSKRRKSVNILEEKILNDENNNTLKIEEEAIVDEDEEKQVDDEKERKVCVEKENGKDDNEESRPSSEPLPNGDAMVGEGKPDSFTENSAPSEVIVSDFSTSPVSRLAELSNAPENSNLLVVQETERTKSLKQQESERPLAKLQENLDKIIEQEEEESAIVEKKKATEKGTSERRESRETHNLLYDDDNELEYLGQALVRIHNEFYFEVEKANNKKNLHLDVKNIMTEMKSIVFENCVFLLSGVLPLGSRIQNADIVIWAKSFGATFVENYTTGVTHVICKNGGTFKVRLAKSVDPNVKVVNPDWVFACMSLWDRIEEDPYIVKVENLLSKSQVDDFLEFHGLNNSFTNNTEALDWGEIDDEMKEFMGSDYEEDENEDEDEDENEEDEDKDKDDDKDEGGIKDSENNKRGDEQKEGNVNRKRTSSSSDVASEDDPASDIKRAKTVASNDPTVSEEEMDDMDDFERDLMEHLADLE